MKIAVIGAGISGLIAASELQKKHDVTVFEKDSIVGGHIKSKTIDFVAKDGSAQILNADLGVFMFEPVSIHPYFAKLAKKNGIELEPFHLSSALDYDTEQIHWSSNIPMEVKARYLWLYLVFFWRGLIEKKAFSYQIYFRDLFRMYFHIEKYCKADYLETLHSSFSSQNKYSDLLMELWIYPLLHLWWGATEETLKTSSLAVFFDSINDVISCKNTFTIKGGADQLPKIMSKKINNLKLNSEVLKIQNVNKKVIVSLANQDIEFDQVVLAVTPNIAEKIIETNNQELINTLKSYDITTTTIHLHSDISYMPRKRKEWAIANMINRKEIGKFSTFWVGGVHPHSPEYFISWGEGMDKIKKNKLIQTESFQRVLPTFNYIDASSKINDFQGIDNLWFCGAHVNAFEKAKTPSLWLDNAILSSMNIVNRINE